MRHLAVQKSDEVKKMVKSVMGRYPIVSIVSIIVNKYVALTGAN